MMNNTNSKTETINNSQQYLSNSEEILRKLTEQDKFIKLRDLFRAEEKSIAVNSSTLMADQGVDKETFLKIVTTFHEDDPSRILDLFNQINIHELQRITWDNFLDFILKAFQPKSENPFQLGEITYHKPKELKRDPIAKIVLLETDLYFSYAVLSKYGQVTLIDANFNYLTSYYAMMSRGDQFCTAKEVRKRFRWLTDALFMVDVNMFVVVNSTRSMTIYDVSGLKHVAVWHISGFPEIIQVLGYTDAQESNDKKKSLVLGMDNGEIILLTFLKPKDDLLPRKHQDKMSMYFYCELLEFRDYLNCKRLGKFHSSPIVDLQVLDDRKTVLTCSRDDKKSLVIINIDYNRVSHCISLKHGINCFVANSNKKLIISGSDNGVVRIWPLHKKLPNLETQKIESAQTNGIIASKTKKMASQMKNLKSLQIIIAGKTGLVDITILESLNIFICCLRDAELMFYDLNDYKNLQNVKLNFQCFDIFTIKTPQWGTKCIFPGPKRVNMSQTWERNYLVVTCCNAYAKLDLFYMDEKERYLHGEFLPPQPMQNSVLIPQDWEYTGPTFPNLKHKNDCTGSWNQLKLFDDLWGTLNCINLDEKDKSDVHSKIALLEERKTRMKWFVEQGVPFLALELYNVEEIQLPTRQPAIENKKSKVIIEKTEKLLNYAVFQNSVFSEVSSSRTSKSSVLSSSLRSSRNSSGISVTSPRSN